jgi:hypothetical protein
VCDELLVGPPLTRLASGRVVYLHPACAAAFDRDPARYAARVLPRGALFQEPLDRAPPLSRIWLYASLYLLSGLVAGGACAYLALGRGRSGLAWFALGLALNVLAFGFLCLSPRRSAAPAPAGLAKVPVTRDPLPCPRCGHLNHPSSDRCLGCGAPLEPRAPSEARR